MTDHDRSKFAEALHVLAETFGEPLSDLRTEAYFDALRDFSIEQVSLATRLSLRTCKFFPRPVELRDLIAGNQDDNAETAWGGLLREVRRVGYMGTPDLEPRTALAVKELWGGWRRLCETLPGEGPELIGWLKQFKETYETVDRRETVKELTAATMHPDVLAFVRTERQKLLKPMPGDGR